MDPLFRLAEHGQSYWLDNLTRRMIRGGELDRRVRDQGLRGVTSNPAIFQKAMAEGTAYDSQVEQEVFAGHGVTEVYEALTTTDVQDACDILRGTYEASAGRDGFVSLEVSPHLAHDTDATIEEARRLWRRVDRPNCLIKIPGLAAGVPAIEQCLYDGINVNVTLLFGVEEYEAVAWAYIRALERRLADGRPLDDVHSVASFFLSRIDVLCDELLGHHLSRNGERARRLMGRAAVANAKLAYQAFRDITATDRWQALAREGATVQRMLWASTSTKNPEYRDVMYVEPLIGPDTVNTLPDATIDAFADHGTVAATVEQGVEEARGVMDGLAELGIDFRFIVQQLQNEGVQKFIDPYDASMRTLAEKARPFHNRKVAVQLAEVSRRLRRDIVRMTTEAGSGHVTSSLSAAEIVAALFFDKMRWDPGDPAARNVDTFVLSKGHATPLLWAALAEAGAIDEDLTGLRRIDSTLEGHPTPRNPWVRVATGSLGQGLAAANGLALANQMDGIPARVYCLLGDGECAEGAVWEAAQFAALNDLNGLVAIVDINGLGQSQHTPYDHESHLYAERFRAFGWRTVEVDGHELPEVLDALDQATAGGPFAILARTVKGKGVSALEGAEGWHGKAMDPEMAEQALAELGEPEGPAPAVQARRVGPAPPDPSALDVPDAPLDYTPGQAVPTRDAFGTALARLGEAIPGLVVLDGDVQNSTRTEYFAKAFPERFRQCFIAEQNMTGVGVGLAQSGKLPVVASFAAFLTRAADFIRMAGHSRPPRMLFCGSHAGVEIGEDGPSQMGLEDLALFRAMGASTILYPCDAVSAERLTEQAVRTPGIVYIRTTRGATPVLYGNDDVFTVGGSRTLRSTPDDRVTVVAAGVTVHEALAAHKALAQRGIPVRVVDAYSVKPLDAEGLRRHAQETGAVVVVEDHWADGGLGDAVAAAVTGIAPVHKLAVRGEPRSGKAEELFERHGISRNAIAAQVAELCE